MFRAEEGSSPLARGLPRLALRLAAKELSGGEPDHPRSRGVYTQTTPVRPRHMGSSPLARGLQSREQQQQLADRIIPARAGFTGAC